ncbi:nuclear fragile X mental retardation-interacting protein 1-like isoform X1 [Centruroides sculpturatus]|uniref:nuclear fragile X mental retardation-interacting protein 1-like isoform X1 n=1 Tax=Centruroides sculpturatus TaxID=218467 RepID=UPI000C6D4E8F|nr:nuclear fragile X mental retardation-interacting protein 1-like isoform X1 [Centruroides sculpturatus]
MYSLPTFATKCGGNSLKSLPLPSVFTSYSNNENGVYDSSPFFTLGSGFTTNNNNSNSLCIKKSYPQPKYKPRNNSGYIRFYGKGNNIGSKQFCCDPCGRAYSEQWQLNQHLAKHVKCDFDGCFFQAHSKLVELHKKLQHYTGLAHYFMKLDTPEDIKRWRETRRKNFPTVEKIKKHEAEQAEKLARGEILETKSFGKMKSSKKHSYYVQRKKFFTKRKRRKVTNQQNVNRTVNKNCNKAIQLPKSVLSDEDVDNTKGMVQKFTGIALNNDDKDDEMDFLFINSEFLSSECKQGANLNEASIEQNCLELDKFSISDSDSELAEKTSATPLSENVMTNGLQQNKNLNNESVLNSNHVGCFEMEDDDETKLKSSYFVADKVIEESDDEKPLEQIIIKKTIEEKPLETKIGGALGSLIANYGSDSEEEKQEEDKIPEKVENKIHEVPKQETTKPAQQLKKTRQMAPSRRTNQSRHRPQYTLLEKLLANEIRHEKNVIMQCIHYIMKKSFFDPIF